MLKKCFFRIHRGARDRYRPRRGPCDALSVAERDKRARGSRHTVIAEERYVPAAAATVA